MCSATDRLPTSTLLAAGLEKRGAIAVASGGLTDIWRGEYYGSPVAIKAFRIYPAQNLKEAKEVSTQPAWGARSRVKILDSLEKSPNVAETVPSKHLAVSWGHYCSLSTRPHLRLGP